MSNRELPRRDSAPHICLNALNNIGGAATVHALMKVRNWRGPAKRFRSDVIERLLRAGLIFVVGDQCSVTPAGRAYLGAKVEQDEGPAPAVVGPRYVAPMRPLNVAKHFPPRLQREGATDFQGMPSVMGGQRVGYWSGRD